MRNIYLLLFIVSCGFFSCKKNCAQPGALRDTAAGQDCQFSSYVFYVTSGTYDTTKILPLVVYLDSEKVSTLDAVAGIAPQSCADKLPNSIYAAGTLRDNSQHTWTAVSVNANNDSITFTGNITSNGQDCLMIKIN